MDKISVRQMDLKWIRKEVSKNEKIKLCQLQGLQGVPNWVLALNIQSIPNTFMILNFGLKGCYNEGIKENNKL